LLSAILEGMLDAPSLSDLILFEIPVRTGAAQLLAELSTSWLAWMERGDQVAVVGVLLGADDGGLAVLLRRVEAWAERHELLALRFEVDGRTYVLQPALARSNTAA
jgi:hypothetical protein